MIDEIWVSPMVHVITGVAVLVTTLLALAVTTLLAVRDKRVSTGASLMMVAAQLALMVQALIGIKLLDQGLGPLQLFIHYVGGLGPLLFYFVYYWMPRGVRLRRWTAPWVTGSAFLFALMAFTIGASYVPGGI